MIVAGNGTQLGNESKISFDEDYYPDNPSLLPALPLKGIEGKAIITTTEKRAPCTIRACGQQNVIAIPPKERRRIRARPLRRAVVRSSMGLSTSPNDGIT